MGHADVHGFKKGKLFAALIHEVGDAEHDLGAFFVMHLRPGAVFEGAVSGLDSLFGVFGRGFGHLSDGRFGRGIRGGHGLATRCVTPLAGDEELAFGDGLALWNCHGGSF